ncbi:MAG: hypothetical protein OXB88_10645 [Bacteriovoracales bacterium]|nr:hypothetical protein [Bacteriovoracales bacterium]
MKRTFRLKKAAFRFLCPLCRVDRALEYPSSLKARHFAHIALSALVLAVTFWPLMGAKALYLGLLVWAFYEWALRLLYRKGLPCPHCGFDIAWYKRDVKTAKKIVEHFWKNKTQASSSS